MHSFHQIAQPGSQKTLIPSKLFIQPKLTINDPNDEYEKEADAIADQVMRNEKPFIQAKPLPINLIQRKCAHCEEEEKKMQRKEMNGNETTIDHRLESYIGDLNNGGRSLPDEVRNFYEPRFGYDFSNVKVHTDAVAAKSAQSINALAYTTGSHIVFNSGQYEPHSSAGQRLLGHELTHVVQQRSSNSNVSETTIRRNVASNSNCPASVHNAPADPIADLAWVDARAQHMALGCSHLLFLESLTFNDAALGGRSYVFDAYRDWFGTPVQTSGGRWRSRFRTSTFATEDDAITHEMQTLGDRFERVYTWFTGNIRYRCPGTSSYTIPGCATGRCRADAESCPGSRTIGICPTFWPVNDGGASLLIHEAMHALFRFQNHPTSTTAGRARNPGCYQGFVDTIYATGSQPGECTTI